MGLSLEFWRETLPLDLAARSLKPADAEDVEVLIFTDGYFPDDRKEIAEDRCARIGWAVFEIASGRAFHGAYDLPQAVLDRWLPRANQIALVELIAPAAVFRAYPSLVANRRIVLLVDSEAAEGALVRGYSSLADMADATGLFWDLVRDAGASVWIDRVPTDANLADGPSRGDLASLSALGSEALRPNWLAL